MHAYTDYKKGLTQPQEISADSSTKKKTTQKTHSVYVKTFPQTNTVW